jgi:hypothetical protein
MGSLSSVFVIVCTRRNLSILREKKLEAAILAPLASDIFDFFPCPNKVDAYSANAI